MRNLICDFEGTTFNGRDKRTRVWLACLSDFDSDNHHIFSDSIESFMSQLYQYCKEANILFHDLGSYDAHFIIDWMLKNDFKHYKKTETVESDKYYIGDDSTNFTVFWNGHVYNFFDTMNFLKFPLRKVAETLGMQREERPNVREPRIDSLTIYKPIPSGGKLVCGSFPKQSLSSFPKGESINHQTIKEHLIQESDYQYIKNNCDILKRATEAYSIVKAIENRIYSIANYSYQTMLYNDTLPLNRVNEFEAINKPKGYKKKYYEKRFTKLSLNTVDRANSPKGYRFRGAVGSVTRVRSIEEQLDFLYKKIKQDEFDSDTEKVQLQNDFDKLIEYFRVQKSIAKRVLYNRIIKTSFRGGFVYINPEYRNKWLDVKGITLDKNSCHPANYVTQKLPNQYVGRVYSYNDLVKNYDLDSHVFFVKFGLIVADVQADKVPIFKLREDDKLNLNNEFEVYENTSNVPSHINYEEYVITEMEYDYLLENYEISVAENVEFLVFTLHTELMKRMHNHGLYWYDKKIKADREHDAFERAISKNMLNFPVGYLGVNPEKYLSKNFGKISSQSNVASASFINAYARVQVAEEANRIGLKYYLYGDTDSLHIRIPSQFIKSSGKINKIAVKRWLSDKGVVIDDTQLGAWKIERWFTKAKFITTRVYGELEETGRWTTKVSGFHGKIAMEDFENGKEVFQNRRETVDGGTLIMKTSYIIGH